MAILLKDDEQPDADLVMNHSSLIAIYIYINIYVHIYIHIYVTSPVFPLENGTRVYYIRAFCVNANINTYVNICVNVCIHIIHACINKLSMFL